MLKRNPAQKKDLRKSQSTVEYIVLVAAVLAFVITFLRPNGPFRKGLTSTYTGGIKQVGNIGGRLWNASGPF